MKNTNRAWKLLCTYPKLAALLISGALVISISETLGMALVLPLLSNVMPDAPKSLSIVEDFLSIAEHLGLNRFKFIAICFFIIFAIRSVFTVLYRYCTNLFAHRFYRDWTARILHGYLRGEYLTIKNTEQAQLTNALIQEMGRATKYLTFLVQTISTLLLGVVLYIGLSILDWKLTLAMAVTFTILTTSARRVTRSYMIQWGTRLLQLNKQIIATLNIALNAVSEIKLSGAERMIGKRYLDIIDESMKTARQIDVVGAIPSVMLEMIAITMVSVGIFWLSDRSQEELSRYLPLAFTFMVVAQRLSKLSSELMGGLVKLNNFTPSLENILSLSENAPAREDLVTGLDSFRLEGKLRFDSVSFRYPEDQRYALKDLSLEVKTRTMTAFVGESGSGKSTFLSILLSLCNPQSGDVWVDDKRLVDISKRAWRRNLSFVGPHSFFFYGTLRENLTFGSTSIADEQLWAVLRAADASDFIQERASGGLDELLVDRGDSFSAGQRQRLALARALLRKAPLLVLDEATGSLDREAEARVLSNLRALPAKPTIIMVTHRMEAARMADRIFRIEAGKAVELDASALRIEKSQENAKKVLEL